MPTAAKITIDADPGQDGAQRAAGAASVTALEADGIAVTLDLSIGHIADLRIERDGRVLHPLHRAPWCDRPQEWPEGIVPGLAGLSGDFFCAPFSANDLEPAPIHGWSANSEWVEAGSESTAQGAVAHFRLKRKIMGATVEKTLRLIHGHPFLYQEHRLIGGEGRLPVAHHAMTRMEAGGVVSFSPKRAVFTPPAAREAGSVLVYPALVPALDAVPLAAGGVADLGRYPLAGRHEDFVMLVEADPQGIGWTTVSRLAEQDMVLVLKDTAALPVTMLWYSHGGRDHAPWNGRHRGVLGIEDGRTAIGHRQSIGDNPLSEIGVATAFDLRPDGVIAVRQVIGAMPLAGEKAAKGRLQVAEGSLRIMHGEDAETILPFADRFLVRR